MAQIDLKSVYRVRSKGRTYFYAWKGRGAPRLKASPGTAEFVRELNDALATRRTGDKSKIESLVIAYRASPDFLDLADSTKRNWNRWLDRVRDHFGKPRAIYSLQQLLEPSSRSPMDCKPC